MTQLETIALMIGTITGTCGLFVACATRRDQRKYAPAKLRVIPKLAFPGVMDEMVNETYYFEGIEDAFKILKTYACVAVCNQGPNTQTVLEVGFIDATG